MNNATSELAHCACCSRRPLRARRVCRQELISQLPQQPTGHDVCALAACSAPRPRRTNKAPVPVHNNAVTPVPAAPTWLARRARLQNNKSGSPPQPDAKQRLLDIIGNGWSIVNGRRDDVATAAPNTNNKALVAPPAAWAAALARQPATHAKAGLLLLQIGKSWPWYLRFTAASASAANGVVQFYFLGPPPRPDVARLCPANCVFLPLYEAGLHARIHTLLGLPVGSVPLNLSQGRKLCDLKPLWPALFPELTQRHAWIGWADHDVVFGDVASEVLRLRPDEELLTPSAFFPQPLTNGNFLLHRSTPKLVQAFRRARHWRTALTSPSYFVFDEHWGVDGDGMHAVFMDLYVAGRLNAVPARRLWAQDILYRGKRVNGAYQTLASNGAKVGFAWNGSGHGHAQLRAWRDGGCACSKQVWDLGLASCAQCLTMPGAAFPQIRIRVDTEVLGVHFQIWKKQWGGAGRRAPAHSSPRGAAASGRPWLLRGAREGDAPCPAPPPDEAAAPSAGPDLHASRGEAGISRFFRLDPLGFSCAEGLL